MLTKVKIAGLALLLLFSAPTSAQEPPSSLRDLTVRQALTNEMTVRELFAILNEREKASNQRFDGQEKAVANALSALEKSTANALAALDKNNAVALTAAKEAVTKAEVAAEKRFDSVNEFRGQLKDQQNTLASKAEVDTRFRFIEDKINSIEARLNRTTGGFDAANWIWLALMAIAGVVIVGAQFFRNTRPAEVKGR